MRIDKHNTRLLKLKYVASINDDTLTEETNPELEISYIDIGNVNSSGNIDTIAKYSFADAPSRARRVVKKGDVIVSTVRTYLQAITAIEESVDNLIVSTGFAVIRPKINIFHQGFCKYALRESSFLAEVQKRSTGVSYPAINPAELGNIQVYVPPFSLQKRISDFLDKEVSNIDSLINSKQSLINSLSEKRIAIVTCAITKGINSKVKFIDSKVDWVGKIPEHWNIERSRWLFIERNEKTETGNEDLLTVSHLTGVTLRSEKEVNMFEAESTEGYKLCKEGDLVVNTLWAWMGAMGVSRNEGIVSPAYHVYTPTRKLSPDYIDYVSRLPLFANEVTRYSKGVWSSRLRLYPEGFYEVYFPVPPIDEQNRIVAYLNSATERIDALIKLTDESISLLKERRNSLINSAVTGLITI